MTADEVEHGPVEALGLLDVDLVAAVELDHLQMIDDEGLENPDGTRSRCRRYAWLRCAIVPTG